MGEFLIANPDVVEEESLPEISQYTKDMVRIHIYYAKNAVKKAFAGSAQKERGYGKESKTTSLGAGVELTVVFFVHTVGSKSLYGNLKSIESMEIFLTYKIDVNNKTEIRHKYRNGKWSS